MPCLHSSSFDLETGLLPSPLPSQMLHALALPIFPLPTPLPALLLHRILSLPTLGCLERGLPLGCAFIRFAADHFSSLYYSFLLFPAVNDADLFELVLHHWRLLLQFLPSFLSFDHFCCPKDNWCGGFPSFS
jgi:hypothetical protein